ncbi:hypothetical protein SKAU_G00045120 [Synaphobranchus kaupii]|uniref:Uncharacterized protein n=1 Tax=Synaphobranchus kaupii TaxID=118154 RepID=A0A9Q1G2V2_SYNKA|nr:hypothetical protein SKAU_G00045120 [Synaphobranchus kaupii]
MLGVLSAAYDDADCKKAGEATPQLLWAGSKRTIGKESGLVWRVKSRCEQQRWQGPLLQPVLCGPNNCS